MASVSTVSSVDLNQLKSEMELSEEDAQKWMQHPTSSLSNKDKPLSPYQTSSVYSDVKPSTAEGSSQVYELPEEDVNSMEDTNYLASIPHDQLQLKFVEYRQKTQQERLHLNERIHTMEVMQQNMTSEATKLHEEKSQLLAHIQELKMLQEAAEIDAEETMKSLEEFVAEQEQIVISDNNDVKEDSNNLEETVSYPLTEDNLQQIDKTTNHPHASSPSTFSKPTSPTTNRSLASAYRQKIAERREIINKRKKDGLLNRAGLDTPQLKGMFDTGLLEEFLRSYRAVVEFKDRISQEMSQYAAHQSKAHSINAVHTSNYDTTNDEVQLYVSNMSTSVEQALSAIQEAVTTTLADFNSTQDNKEAHLHQKIATFQEELSQLRSEYEKRIQHDSAMIMHMQNTLSETQRGNTTAAGTSGSGFPSSPTGPIFGKTPSTPQHPQTNESELTIVFTRNDTESNARALKKSAAVGKITQETLESAVMTMETYNAIPARRIQHLAHKLLHHTKMKIIETNVRNSNLVTSEVFNILERMESLQQRRAFTWSRQMDELALERRHLANILSDALQRLESITGVFMIKPIVSYKGRGHFKKYSGKISTRFNKHQIEAMLQKMQIKKSFLNAATPYTNQMQVDIVKSMCDGKATHPPLSSNQKRNTVEMKAHTAHNGNEELIVSGLKSEKAGDVWHVGASVPRSTTTCRLRRENARSPIASLSHPSTFPKLFELDVTRHQLAITNVHSLIPSDIQHEVGNDRIRNMELLSLRTRKNFPRNSNIITEKSTGNTPTEISSEFKSSDPPTTPASISQVIGRCGSSGMCIHSASDVISTNVFPSPKSLPPIRRTSTRSSLSSVDKEILRLPVSPCRSMPDIRFEQHTSSASPMSGARKDMGTSPPVYSDTK